MPRKKWTSRRIGRDIIILLLVITVAVLTPVAYLASQARKDISEEYIHRAADQAVSQFLTMSGSMEATLGLVRDWGASEAFSVSKTDELTRLLFPIFGREKLLNGISIADIDGGSFYIHHTVEGYRSSRVSASGSDRVSEEIYWTPEFKPAETFKTNSVYDARNRPWFAPSLTSDRIFWTEPYKFFTSGDIGITASTSYQRKKDDKPVVIAFDILLDSLFEEMHQLAPSESSRIFLFRRDARMYVPRTESLKAEFVPIDDAGNELANKVHTSWYGDQALIDKVVSVMHEGRVWWCGFRPLDHETKYTWICVMVPEDDIIPIAGKRSKRLWLIGILSILVATGLAVWMIRRYGRPNDSTAVFSREDPEGSVRSIIADGENRYVEFKSTMRMNLHTKKPGKEIEMAWMKGVAGFLNTDGGILLIGVTDDGEITGLERDVFENEDKCRLHFKNLISKHIGADLSKYVRFIIVPMEGKTVGVVRCDRAEEPVFVKDGNKEHFYIRNGPSSDELPVSQALNYIKHRG
ncbi:putative DNA binding domain-containing protein [Pontiellaceae bacterium B12227]|nr:putative DNA binding domain-containing protein [Pontiellaceae bacterium B12227]